MTHERTELAVAMGRFFARWQYDHFAVLTFDHEVDGDHALREAQRWIRRVEKFGGGKAWSLTTAEIGEAGRVHVHALTINTAPLPEVLMSGVWHHGRAVVERCHDPVRAAHYIVKNAGTPRLVTWKPDLPPIGETDTDHVA